MKKPPSLLRPDIIALGEPLIELSAEEALPLADARRFVTGFGGDTSNFAVAVSRLGGRAGYVSRLGDDEFGRAFRRLWKEEGVDCRHVTRDPSAPTGLYFISRPKDGRHEFTYYRKNSAASRMRPNSLPADYIRGAKFLHVTGISQGISRSAAETVMHAVALAKEAGVKVSYDPNFRPKLWSLRKAREIIHRTIPEADLVFPSLEDASQLTGLDDPKEILQYYLGLGAGMVVLKMGDRGALLAKNTTSRGTTRRQIKTCPAFSVQPLDTSGAGDTFDAAFVVGLVAGQGLDRCLRFANAAAALSTTGLGAVTPIPSLEQVQAFIHRKTKPG